MGRLDQIGDEIAELQAELDYYESLEEDGDEVFSFDTEEAYSRLADLEEQYESMVRAGR